MKIRILIGLAVIAACALGQGSAPVPRIDGHPDLTGIWQAFGTANWDLEDHGPEAGPLWQLGAIGAIPPGRGVVEGGTIPYKPEALEQRKKNRANRWKDDPEMKCYMGGIPRSTYMPYPFQIIQGTDNVLMAYQFASANRNIHVKKHLDAATDTWMGTANAHWEGDTFVVDSRGFNDLSWLDRSGNYHSDQLHVVERFTRTDRDHIRYEATIEDPEVFTRPWKIALWLNRDMDPSATLGEFKCVEMSEELLYRDLNGPNAR